MSTAPRFHALAGVQAFDRCDHSATVVDVNDGVIRLASEDVVDDDDDTRLDPDVWDSWYAVRGGGAWVPSAADRCSDGFWFLGTAEGELYVGDRSQWMRLGEQPSAEGGPEGGPESGTGGGTGGGAETGATFAPGDDAAAHVAGVAAASLDHCGRLWLLGRGGDILLLDATRLTPVGTVAPPPDSHLTHLATTNFGVVAIELDAARIWRAELQGTWIEVPRLGTDHVPVAVASLGDVAVVLMRPTDPLGSYRVVVVGSNAATYAAFTGLENPLPMIGTAEGRLLVGELDGPVGSRLTLHEFDFRLDALLATGVRYGVNGFDGRALFLDGAGTIYASTRTGASPVFELRGGLVHTGQFETFAFDSEQYGCVWNRVFVDACVPSDASIELFVRTSDDLPEESVRRRPPVLLDPSDPLESVFDSLPFGSRSIDDDEGWESVGHLDRRALLSDLPFGRNAVQRATEQQPSEEGCRTAAGSDGPFHTFDGLVKSQPGRYLWLRVALRGNGRTSPRVREIRVWRPRPSLLDHLPRFWKDDPAVAQRTDEFLSLFESELTAERDRITGLPWLFDPCGTPEDALEWLASFLAVSLDRRVPIARRRRLVANTAQLYRQRGTLPGLELLVSILTGSPAIVIEAFRLRRESVAYIGSGTDPMSSEPSSVLGPGFVIGDGGPRERRDEVDPVEVELAIESVRLDFRREARIAWIDGEPSRRYARPVVPGEVREDPPAAKDVCMPADPPSIDLAESTAYYRRHAHRFTVVMLAERSDDLAAVVEEAVERTKPAHTLHDLCWLDAGFRVGASTYVGIGTRLAGVDLPEPMVLGRGATGSWSTLSVSQPAERGIRPLGTFAPNAGGQQ